MVAVGRTIIVVSLLLMVLTAQAQQITVKSTKDADVDFRGYQTYFWASQIEEQGNEGKFFLNDVLLKADIRDLVHRELESRGYRLDENSPDLLVNFRVFDKAVTLNGLQGYGSNYWGEKEITSNVGEEEIKIEPGTLIISLVDKREGKLVWQGFASGLMIHESFTKEEGYIREVVETIFDAYGIRVNEYTKR
jgi:hypothetical protein